jgi:hypothetical protein
MTEFDDVIRLLEENRPQASNQELDAIKQRVRRRAAEPSRRSQSMKSRVAILGMLVTGILFSTAGAGLALSGVQSQHNASVSQYTTPTPTPTPVCTTTPSPGKPSPGATPSPGGSTGSGTAGGNVCEEGGVLPAEETNAPTSGSKPATSSKPTTGSGNSGGVLPAQQTQPERQAAAAATTSQLPFTGYAAIPVLLGGLVLLTGGLFLRRRTSS